MINSVRNTVLAILNKNNYGYISPGDFNLYAKQAQLDIFDDYFYQYNQLINQENARLSGTGYADVAKGYEIDYVYKSSHIAASRTGTMVIVVDPTNDTVNFSDDYNYTGSNTYAENLKFKAQTYDEDGDLTVDTLAIMMLNLTSSDDAVLHYKVKTKS